MSKLDYDYCDETDYVKLANPWIKEHAEIFEEMCEKYLGTHFFARGAAQMLIEGHEGFIQANRHLAEFTEEAVCYLYVKSTLDVDQEVENVVKKYWNDIYEDYINRTSEFVKYQCEY